MDKVDIAFAQNAGDMTLQLESRGTNLLRSADVRFTDEELQVEYSGDEMGEYIYRMGDLQLRWGGQRISSSGGGSPRGPDVHQF